MAILSSIKSGTTPLNRIARTVSPTGIGVLLSVGAHIAFIAYGPRPNFSFAALSETAAQQEAEETIVPIIELSEAERSRLPSFAQPRQPPTAGLGSLPLPTGLSSIPNGTLNQRLTPAAPLPSPTTRQQRIPSLGANFGTINRPRRPIGRVSPPPAVSVVPAPQLPRSQALPTVEAAPVPSTVPSVIVPSQESSPPDSGADALQPQPGRTIDDQLRALEAGRNEQPVAVAPEPENSVELSEETPAADIPFPEEPIVLSAAQGDPDQLRDSFVYDPTDVDEEAARENLTKWIEESSDVSDGEMARETTEITIDSNFKVCKEVPPARGLIGVVVNPDGSQESLEVLKSIGYDLLNRQAVDAVTYNEFETPEVATQYEVSIEVNYNADACINGLPE